MMRGGRRRKRERVDFAGWLLYSLEARVIWIQASSGAVLPI